MTTLIIITNRDASNITRFTLPNRILQENISKWIATELDEGGVTSANFDRNQIHEILQSRDEAERDRAFMWLGKYYAQQVNAR